ncbi:MAG TPA: response regulator [Phycisphaerae bacterium]|nr:response regulator [Phycisphaerae bacterium]
MTQVPSTILVIEDEQSIRRFIRPSMEAEGWQLIEAATGKEGLLAASQRPPDVIVLDLGLPDMDGLEVIRRLREWTAVPIIILSARGQESDKIAGLDAGADDYVAKPFAVGELMARIRVALRHAAQSQPGAETSTIVAGDITIDLLRREVRRKGKDVRLTPIEYKLLATLVRHAGLVLTHRQILNEVWGPGYGNESHYLRIFIHQLRHKLEENPSHPRHLITEAGVGYRFRLE